MLLLKTAIKHTKVRSILKRQNSTATETITVYRATTATTTTTKTAIILPPPPPLKTSSSAAAATTRATSTIIVNTKSQTLKN